jgi:hypothetical protein
VLLKTTLEGTPTMSDLGTAFFDCPVELAKFIAELVRQGVTFQSYPKRGGHEVILTGGH